MWLVYGEKTDGCTIMHARNGRKYSSPELSRTRLEGFCAETRTVYKFFGCLFHGHTCLPFRDVTTLGGDNLAERYVQTMAILRQITSARYTVEVMWECQFDKDILPRHCELKQHRIVLHAHLNTSDVLYGVKPRQWFFTTQYGRRDDSISRCNEPVSLPM